MNYYPASQSVALKRSLRIASCSRFQRDHTQS